jgi:hypothetical protein
MQPTTARSKGWLDNRWGQRQRTSTIMKKMTVLFPVALTLFPALWTASVYSHSHYGSWQIYPALAILPLVLICHIAFIVNNNPKMPFCLYTLGHLIVLIPLWMECLMLISKDSI